MNGGGILVGITGGIAAFKTAALISRLAQDGFATHVVLTSAAQRFLGPATCAALTGHRVWTDLFDPEAPQGAHIHLAELGSLLCVAPASADFLAKAASGLADDLLSTLYLAFPGPVLMAPAMNSQMWQKPAVQRNVQRLREDGVHIVEPEEGWLSCRVVGPGRMAEPETIREAILKLLPVQGSP